MKKLLSKFSLTKREQLVIDFLLITFTIGLIIKLSGWKKPNEYDYTDADKRFDEQLKTEFDELEKQEKPKLTPEQEDKAGELKRFSDSLITSRETTSQKPELKPGKKININSAYAADLQLLPGIGEIIAERIIDYREQKGSFKKPEDIKKVKGIGDKKFEQIKDYITVE
jgi:comEA protein